MFASHSLFSTAIGMMLALFCMVGGIAQARENSIQPHADIVNAAKTYLLKTASAQHTGRIEVQIGHLDPRLRLTRCSNKLEAFQPSGNRTSGHTSVGVRCADTTGWSLYVPAVIDVYAKALVTTRILAKGTELTTDDVELVETKITGEIHEHIQSLDKIQGRVARRSIAAGTILTPSMVKAPHLVRRGDRVTLVTMQGQIQVEMTGEAVNDGARGDRVRVRALNSQRIVEGWVVSPSVVKVTL